MVTIEELKLGNRTLEALKFLLSQITELETVISQINISEIKDANTLTKEQIATLQDVKNTVESINIELSSKKSDFDEKKQNFDTNLSTFRNDKADFDEKKSDFDSKNNTALSNFAFIASNVEKINKTSDLLAEAKAILEQIKPIEQRAKTALETLANSQSKFAELDALKATLLELKRSLENISTTGLITDTKVSTTQTYSSKKIEDLVSNAKTTLTEDIKSKTDSLTTVMNNQKQSITTALSQKVDTTTYNTFATKVTNDLSNKANKTDVLSMDTLKDTFLEKTKKATDSDKLDGLDSVVFARKDTTDTQEFGANLSVGTKVAAINEGGQIDFAAAPLSGLGNSYIDVVSDRSGYANFRMMQRTSSNEFVGLVFPPVSGTVFSSGNMGVGSGLDAEKLGGMGYSSTSSSNNIVQRDTNGDFASRWITASYFLMKTNAQDNIFNANSEICFRMQQTSEDSPTHMRFVTLAKFKELVCGGFGTGQTLQDLTSQRQWNVTYENTSDKPIYVSVVTNSSSTQIALTSQLFINEMLVCENYPGNKNNVKQIATVCGIVPKGARYRVFTDYSGQTHIKKWFEFR